MLPLSTYSTLEPKIKKIFDEISFRVVNGRIQPLVVDESNLRVGIRTDSPVFDLDVNGNMGISGPLLAQEINVFDLKARSVGVSQHLIAGQATFGNVVGTKISMSDWNWKPFTPTFTGFSVIPTGFTSRYCQIGKLVVWSYAPVTQGTSNAVTFTMSIPVTAASFTYVPANTRVKDNGVWQDSPGLGGIGIASANTLSIFKTLSGADFTNSGGKDVAFVLMYEAI